MLSPLNIFIKVMGSRLPEDEPTRSEDGARGLEVKTSRFCSASTGVNGEVLTTSAVDAEAKRLASMRLEDELDRRSIRRRRGWGYSIDSYGSVYSFRPG